jgi:outer membrane cobalamin receptor
MRRIAAGMLAVFALPVVAQRPTPSLDTVRVTSRASAPLAAATRSVEVVTREELDRRAGRSLAELIGFALGADVQTRSPAQSDLSLRGSTFNQVVVLVDGVRVSDVQSGHYALDLAVPTAMIERIEILRGSGSALYGSDAVGGVVNIVTRDDRGAASLGLRGGSFGGAGASALGSGETGPVTLIGGADVDRSDGHRSGTDYRITQLRLSAGANTRAGHVVADVGEGVRRFGAADFYSPYNSDETTRSLTSAVRLVPSADAPVSVSGSIHARRHYDLFTLKRDQPAFYQNEHISREAGADATVRAVVAPAMVAAVGAELLDARLESARLGDHRQTRRGTFAELTLGQLRGPTLDLGVRGDWTSDVGGFASPSIGAALPVAASLQLRGSASRGFRAPTWTERYYQDPSNIADSSLSVEKFWSGEIGARWNPSSWAIVDLAYFERHATDLIDWARPEGSAPTVPWRTMNFAAATYRGVETSVRLPALLGIDWTARASGLRFDASAASGTVGKYALRPITRTVGLSAETGVAREGTLTVDALRARRTGESDHVQLNARLLLPTAVGRASLELINALDASYLDGAGKPVAPRSVFVGLMLP